MPDLGVIVGGEDEDDEEAYRDGTKRQRKSKWLVSKLADLTGIAADEPKFQWSAPFVSRRRDFRRSAMPLA